MPVPYVAAEDRYDRMQYRRSGRSGLQLPAVSLGLWHNFGHDRPLETQRAILRRAFDRGVTHFDLANNYGPPYFRVYTRYALTTVVSYSPQLPDDRWREMSAIPDNASVAVSRHLILKYPALKLEICWTCTQVYNTPVTVKEAAKLSGHSHTVDTRK